MSQNHDWVGQTLVQDHSHQPEGEEDRVGDAVDVGRDNVDLGCKNPKNKQTRRYTLILPSAVFLPWGLDLIKAANSLDEANMVKMTNTMNVISDYINV